MALQKFLNSTTLDKNGKKHIQERHINDYSGKSRFLMEAAEVFNMIQSIITEARSGANVEATYTDSTGYYLKTVILRKVFEEDIGLNHLYKKDAVRSIYVILVDEKVKTAYPVAVDRTHNGLFRKEHYEVIEEDYEIEEHDEEEDEVESEEEYYSVESNQTEDEEIVWEELWA